MSESTIATTPGPATRPGTSDAIAGEFTKLWSVRSQRRLLLSTIPVAAVVSLVAGATLPQSTGRSLGDYPPQQQLGAFVYGTYAAAILAIVVAAGFVGAEYSTRQTVTTFAVTPHRSRVLTAKIVTIATPTIAMGVVSAAICVGVGTVVTPGGLDMGAPGMVRIAILIALQPVFYGLLAALAAFVFRGTPLAVVGALAVFLVLPAIGKAVPGDVDAVIKPLMPVAGLHSIAGSVQSGSTEDIGTAAGVAVVLAWLIVAYIAARVSVNRRDV